MGRHWGPWGAAPIVLLLVGVSCLHPAAGFWLFNVLFPPNATPEAQAGQPHTTGHPWVSCGAASKGARPADEILVSLCWLELLFTLHRKSKKLNHAWANFGPPGVLDSNSHNS
uniref:Secreted protein n=1 Tax=Anolis carolinensis TaxID=28377 RepID=A0A803SRB1_ANOCA